MSHSYEYVFHHDHISEKKLLSKSVLDPCLSNFPCMSGIHPNQPTSRYGYVSLTTRDARNVIGRKFYFLHWKPLYARRALYDISLFYKIRNGLIAIPFPVEVQPSFMNNMKYQHIQVLHAENYRNSFFPRIVRLWNALPVSCQSAPSVDIFNSQCQSWRAPRTWSTGFSGPISRKRYMEILFRAVQYIRVIVDFFMALEVLHDRKVQYGYSLSDSTSEDENWLSDNIRYI